MPKLLSKEMLRVWKIEKVTVIIVTRWHSLFLFLFIPITFRLNKRDYVSNQEYRHAPLLRSFSENLFVN